LILQPPPFKQKPCTKTAAKIKKTVLTKKTKKTNVKKVIGKFKLIKIGCNVALNLPSPKAATVALLKPSTLSHSGSSRIIKKLSVMATQVRKIPILRNSFQGCYVVG
jgi:hypothetical protein